MSPVPFARRARFVRARWVPVAALVLATGSTALARTPASDALAGLSETTRQALEAGEIVQLESRIADLEIGARFAAVLPGAPRAVVEEIRDYEVLVRSFPEVRSIRCERGTDADVLQLEVKPHPLLPRMDFRRRVEWSLDQEGTASVGITLVDTSAKRVQDQRASWRILPLSEDRSLVFYETTSTYRKLPFRERVARALGEASEKLVAVVRDGLNESPANSPGVALARH